MGWSLDDPRRKGLVRLNNRAIYLVLGIVSVLLVVFMATLQSPADARVEGEPTSLKHVEPDRWWEAQPDGAVGLPAVGSSRGHPTLVFPSEASGPSVDERFRDAALRAMEADIFMHRAGMQRAQSGPSYTPPAAPALPRNIGVPMLPEFESARPGDLNRQAAKSQFMADARSQVGEAYLKSSLLDPVSPYEIKAGTILPAVLITGASADLPGQLIAQVRENVRDTVAGNHVLIPQGTRILCAYDSAVTYGQRRLLVAGQRLIFPNGQSLDLKGQPIVDLSGQTGMHDQVNRHLLRTFGTAMLLSAISGGVQLSQGTFDDDDDDRHSQQSAREILAGALGQQLGTVTTEMLRCEIDVQPTLEIRPGYRFNIEVTQDIVMPGPYKGD